LLSKLQSLTIDPAQVITLDKDAQEHYQQAMDSGDHVDTYVPSFELFTTVISHISGGKKVKTRAISIKCITRHQALLRELFSCLFTHPPPELAHIQLALSGIVSHIGHDAYHEMLRDNNKYFDNLAMISIKGLLTEHLDLDLPVNDPDPNKCMTIRDIIMSTEWCTHIETTTAGDRTLLVTSKLHLKDARQWVDEHLKILFGTYLPKNCAFKAHPDYPIPIRSDRLTLSSAASSYADKLLNTIPKPNPNNKKTHDRFNKFPI